MGDCASKLCLPQVGQTAIKNSFGIEQDFLAQPRVMKPLIHRQAWEELGLH